MRGERAMNDLKERTVLGQLQPGKIPLNREGIIRNFPFMREVLAIVEGRLSGLSCQIGFEKTPLTPAVLEEKGVFNLGNNTGTTFFAAVIRSNSWQVFSFLSACVYRGQREGKAVRRVIDHLAERGICLVIRDGAVQPNPGNPFVVKVQESADRKIVVTIYTPPKLAASPWRIA